MTSDVSLLTLMTSMSVAVGGLHNAAKIEATISSASGGGGRGIGGGGRFNHLGLSIGSLGLSVGRHLEAPSVTEALAAMCGPGKEEKKKRQGQAASPTTHRPPTSKRARRQCCETMLEGS